MNGALRRSWSGRTVAVTVVAMATLLTACGGDDDDGGSGDGGTAADDAGAGEASLSSTEVCALLTDGEIESVLGAALPSEPNDYPDGSPFPGCSWQTGRLIVQVAPGATPVTAPGQDCPTLDLGDVALQCPGSVQVVVGGSRAIVSTIEDLTPDQLASIAEILVAKL